MKYLFVGVEKKMNEVNEFLNSNLEPHKDFYITSKVTPREVREYLEELGWEYSAYDKDYWHTWVYFFNPESEKRLGLSIDVQEFKIYLYWMGE